MPTLVVKNLPQQLHERLKQRAQAHHRSVTKEVIHLIENGVNQPPRAMAPLPPAYVLPGGPLTQEEILAAVAARDGDAAEAAMRRHMLGAQRVRIRQLSSEGERP